MNKLSPIRTNNKMQFIKDLFWQKKSSDDSQSKFYLMQYFPPGTGRDELEVAKIKQKIEKCYPPTQKTEYHMKQWWKDLQVAQGHKATHSQLYQVTPSLWSSAARKYYA